MRVLNCLIVEDEPLAAKLISDYVEQVSFLSSAGICEDAFSALEKLRNENVDLIFLDINLPKLSGIDLIKTLKKNYSIILTTAYHQYALEGYALDVVDYLMKPIEFTRFLQAVNKVADRKGLKRGEPEKEKKHYFFNVGKTHVKVFAEDILYVESLKDYVKICTTEKNLITKFQIGAMGIFLGEDRFLRIHKSFIINTNKVLEFSASVVTVGQRRLPIGRTYKENVEAVLKRIP